MATLKHAFQVPMPSPRKRIGFLPRAEVQEIIDVICIEENLSQSKVVGILVEEALAARGIFDPRLSRKFNESLNLKPINDSTVEENYGKNIESEELISDSGSSVESSSELNVLKEYSDAIQEEDLAILAKIKSLKSLGFL
tara:strand:+ start:118 stop:537 length:420 start_codon:yes stop_codon:yes gene_type:complete